MEARADLHVHTKYSDRPSEWILRRIGSPESFTEPLEVYERCRARGMTFVTISDHNRIEGALAISHLPGTFISSEITTYFPEDGAKLHCLVTGVTESQFAIINKVRENIYDFQHYLLEQEIVYSVAHPLFRVNDRLSPDHIEKLLLLFNRFEAINGTRDPRASEVVNAIFRAITPDIIARMADRHGIEPVGPTPWKKCFTGGSDDHGGVYIASAFTTTPAAPSVAEFLEHLRRGNHEAGGTSGSSVKLAHSFYHIAYSYYRNRFMGTPGGGSGKPNLIGELFRRLLEVEPPAENGLRQRAKRFVNRLAMAPKRRQFSEVERTLVDEFGRLLKHVDRSDQSGGGGGGAGGGGAGGEGEPRLTDQQTFLIASHITDQLGYTFVKKFIEHARQGSLIESLQTIAALGPVAMSISPYLAAMATQHKDERFIQAVADRFESAHHLRLRSDRRAWVTDTFIDVNGVSRTIRTMAGLAKDAGRDLTVLTCLANDPSADFPLRNFHPVGEFNLPEYENQKLAIPPFLEVLEYLERQRFSQIIISTPGPMGLVAMAAGKLLGIQLVGIYHTDFPMYVRHLTQDPALEEITWRYMAWFYDQMDTIFAPSDYYRRELIDGGLDAGKTRVLHRGVDLEHFSPARRRSDFWQRFGLGEGFKFICVGRVSEEKNIRRLLDDFTALQISQGVNAHLAIVGDGPLLAELRRSYRRPGIAFTGLLEGDELARAYASADAFVFPSTTDTFGNVVLEALASGLPAIVTNRGGPQEIIQHLHTGMVVDLDHPNELIEAMRLMVSHPTMRTTMAERARAAAMACDWRSVFDELWNPRKVDEAVAPSIGWHGQAYPLGRGDAAQRSASRRDQSLSSREAQTQLS